MGEGRRRRHPPRRRSGRLLPLAAAGFVIAVASLGVFVPRHLRTAPPASGGAAPQRGRVATTGASPASPNRPTRLVEHRIGSLRSTLQDAAGAAQARHAVLIGGLTSGDTSAAGVEAVAVGSNTTIAQLPQALHDAAAVTLGGEVYVFGGGDGSSQHDDILELTHSSAPPAVVGRLPVPSSDHAAAAIGGTAYVVGGYTGVSWLDTIVAWRPGRSARVVGHLPKPLRYAAVTAVGETLVIAGGSLPDGTASSAVWAFRPSTGRVSRVGHLPAPTTHATAGTLAGEAIVLGGRTATPGTPTRLIVAIDPAARRVRVAGRLVAATSDSTAVTLGDGILVAGGRTRAGTVADVWIVKASGRSVQTRGPAINVYADDGAGMLTGAARRAVPRIYVPNSESGTVDVIAPDTGKIVDQFAVGALPQHVTPAYDLRTLYVLNDAGNSITPIDPATGKPGGPIRVDDPYNMYFTPDGHEAIVVAERLHRLDFRDPHTFRLHRSLPVPCAGVDHADFSADGGYMIVSCEFSGQLLKIDLARERVTGTLRLPDGPGGMPQDVKLSPDGRLFYVADMRAGGLWEIDGRGLRVTGFLRTGAGVHGLYPSRDARLLYATNRGEGTISVISFRTRKVVATWRIPGGSPDMGGVSADGKTLWLSGRYDGEVYAISTETGRLRARIAVGSGPHGLCVWPQPGRYSLGHTGILR